MSTRTEGSGGTEGGGTEGGGESTVRPGLEVSWRLLEVGGVLLAVLGVLAVLFPLATGLSVSVLLGGLLVVGALVHVAHAFRAPGWTGFAWQVLLGIVYAVAGVAMLANPVLGLASLTLIVVAYFVVSGAVELAIGGGIRGQPNWLWMVVSGALSVLLGAVLWLGLLGVGRSVVGLVLGAKLATTGVAMLLVGRGADRTASESGAGEAAG